MLRMKNVKLDPHAPIGARDDGRGGDFSLQPSLRDLASQGRGNPEILMPNSNKHID